MPNSNLDKNEYTTTNSCVSEDKFDYAVDMLEKKIKSVDETANSIKEEMFYNIGKTKEDLLYEIKNTKDELKSLDNRMTFETNALKIVVIILLAANLFILFHL